MARAMLAAAFALILLSSASAYVLNSTREEMLSYYNSEIEPKVPKTAKILLGDERINVEVGGRTIGIQTVRGELAVFEFYPLEKPGVEIIVDDSAAEAIGNRKMGVMQAMESGGVSVKANNFFSFLKVEMIKRIYAVSGADDAILGNRKGTAAAALNSMMVQKIRIQG